MFYFTVWKFDFTHGSEIVNLKYLGLSRAKKILLFIGSVVVPYLFEKEEKTGLLSPIVEKQKLDSLGKSFQILSFLNTILFHINGNYRNLLERLLLLPMVPIVAKSTRIVNFDFINRQLLWQTFMVRSLLIN